MWGIELYARRTALGLSQGRLAAVLGVAQNTVSAWEKGTRTVPDGIGAELARLEDAREDMVDLMLAMLDDHPDAALRVHASDAAFWVAHPECDGLPHEVQLIAAAMAAAITEPRPAIVPA